MAKLHLTSPPDGKCAAKLSLDRVTRKRKRAEAPAARALGLNLMFGAHDERGITAIGRSVEGRAIHAYPYLRPGCPTTLIFGGFHGDEPKSVSLARNVIAILDCDPEPFADRGYVVVPLVNPDGYERRRRRNQGRVDINRNFPTVNWRRTSPRSRMFGGDEPASEPETLAVMSAVHRYRPALIITIHSISGGRECNNYDGPGKEIAEAMHRHNGYPVTDSIGYPTPGSFGAWAGTERNIPTITLELPARDTKGRCWADNRAALVGTR